MTGGAIDFHEVALPEILDPHKIERLHSAPFLECSRDARKPRQWRIMLGVLTTPLISDAFAASIVTCFVPE